MADGKNELGMDHKTTSWFAYIISWISGIIVVATVKNDSKARLHAWQSIIFGAAYTIVIIINYIIAAIFPFFSFGRGLFNVIGAVAWIGFVVVTVICIIKATQDDIFKIPVVYGLAEKQK